MTDTHLQYYKGLQSDIKAVEKRIEFIKFFMATSID